MPSSSEARGPVELLADEFLARHKRGEKPTIGEYCAKHPDLAEEIRDVFEALLMVEELKPGPEEVSGSFGDSVRIDGKRLERIGDYRILREIGRGGMGVVYEAEQEALGRRVALKVLPKTLTGDGKALIRFQREAKAAARMHHTNIVPVFDVGQDGDHVFYAMQLIHGQGLDLVIDDLKRLRDQSTNAARSENGAENGAAVKSIAASLLHGHFEQENLVPPHASDTPETAAYEASPTSSAVLPGQSELSSVESNRRGYYRSVAQIGLQTASALAYAHARGIIHRDIKPGNLLLDAAGNVWVTDFGLAKTDDGGVTHTGDILGTIRYMAPERFRGQCDVRADVYALGLTLYELLAFKPAYASADRLKLIDQIRQAEPPTPRSLDPRIPLDLETIIVKAIDKDPKRRYQSADELAEDLQRFVADEPIKARRIGALERFSRWCRRNPALASSLGLAAAALLAVATVSVVFARTQAENSANLAKANRELDLTNQNLLTEQVKTAKALKASEEQTAINRRQLARMSVDQATKRMDDGDLYSALVLSTHALKLDGGDPERAAIHRQRIASILQQCPRPVQVWNYTQVMRAELSRDGKHVLIVSSDQPAVAGKWTTEQRRVQVWALATGKAIEPWKAAGDDVFFAQFSSDGRRVATLRGDLTKVDVERNRRLLPADLEVWDLATQKPIGPPLKLTPESWGRGGDVSGETLFTFTVIPSEDSAGPRQAELSVWETATGKQRLAWSIELDPKRRPGPWHKVAFFDASGQHAVTIGQTLQLWDATTGKLRKETSTARNS